MMNNKGQVLVLFVLILPLLISLMCIVVSFGNQYLVKRNVDNNIKQAIKYGLKHLDDENVKSKMSYLLKENITDIDSLYIDVSNNKITVSII
ncbi:MAG: pilus assembly protein, partial [Bacilli bacterium]